MNDDALSKIESNHSSSAACKALLSELDKFATYVVEAKKTSLHITNGRAFLGVHPRKNGLLLNIVTNTPLSSERVKKSEKVSANRYHNEILITSVSDVGNPVLDWLKEAYLLTSRSTNH